MASLIGIRGRVLLVAACLAAGARPVLAQSLSEVLGGVYRDNPQLLSERAQLRATDEGVPEAEGGWRPTVSLTAGGGFSNASQTQTSSVFGPSQFAESQNPANYGVSLTQALYTGGKTTAATRKAKALVAAETAHLASVEQSVLLAAATDYLDVLAARETEALAIGHERGLKDLARSVEERFQAGELTRTDAAEAEAAISQGIAAESDAASALAVAEDSYARDIGLPPGPLTWPSLGVELPETKGEAVALATLANPDAVSAGDAVTAAEADVGVTRSQLRPSLSLTLNAARATDPGLQLSRTDQETALAQLTVPLYDGGIVHAEVRAAEAMVAVKERDADTARLKARAEAAAASDQMRAAETDSRADGASVAADRVALQGMEEEARTGGRSVFDILGAEATLYQAETGLVRARHDAAVARLTLAAAIGRLTARALALPVAYDDPGRYLAEIEGGDQPMVVRVNSHDR